MINYPRIITNSGVTRITPVSASIDLKLMPLSSAELELLPGETIPARSYVEMFTENGSAGIFRSRPITERYGSRSTHVALEHAATEMNDWKTEKISEQEKAANVAISTIFNSYGGSRWALGTISPTANVILSANYSGVLDAIIDIVEQLPDYMITFNQSVTPWTLNVVARPSAVSAEGRLSRNIESVEISRDDSELYNRVYIEGVTGHLDDTTSQNQYGIVEYHITETGYTAAQAQRIAQAFLDAHKEPKLSVTIDAVDLFAITGESWDKLEIGKRYRLTIPEDGVVIEQLVVGLHYDEEYAEGSCIPERAHVTLAADPDDVVNYLKKQRKGGGRAQAKNEDKFKEFETWATNTDTLLGTYAAQFVDILGDGTNEGRLAIAETAIEQTASDVSITAQASGILLDANGHPVLDQHGHYQYDPNAANTTLISKLNVNTTNISTLVSKTGINSLGQNETLYSKIDQNADSISLIVDSNGVKRAAIIAAINGSGGSSVTISADNIDLDGYVIADSLAADIADLYAIQVNSINGDNAEFVRLDSEIFYADEAHIGEVDTNTLVLNGSALSNCIVSASVSGNTLTLTPLVGQPINFSKAGSGSIDSIQKVSQAWKPAYFDHGGWDVVVNAYGTGVAPYQDTIMVDGANAYSAGWAEGYDDGVSDGKTAAGVTINVNNKTVDRALSSATKSVAISAVATIGYNSTTHKYTAYATAKAATTEMDSDSEASGTEAYDAGVAAGIATNFILTTVTPQGEQDTVFVEMASGGYDYYKAGTATNYYPGDGGEFTVQGTSAGTIYKRKTSGAIRITGSKQTITTRGTPIYFKAHAKTETPTGLWYSMIGSSSGATQTYYTSGSEMSVYPTANSGGTLYYLSDGSDDTLYNAGTVTKHDRGTAVPVTPINASSKKHLVSTVRYKAGTPVSDTYYIRAS